MLCNRLEVLRAGLHAAAGQNPSQDQCDLQKDSLTESYIRQGSSLKTYL